MNKSYKYLITLTIFFLFCLNGSAQYGAPDPLSVGSGPGNTVVGDNAGNNASTGSQNSIYGTFAGSAITSGSGNSFFGQGSGQLITEAFGNSFFGQQSGSSNLAGEKNSFFGLSTGTDNQNGRSNSFYGAFSGQDNINGNDNSYFGKSAGVGNKNGSNNTFLGTNSGDTVNGSNNVFIGHDSGPDNSMLHNISNRLFIDIQDSVEPLIYGEFDNDFVRINGTFEVTAGLNNPSDVKLKDNFTPIDERIILDELSNLNISKWTYKAYPDQIHIGPTAQDFYQAFHLGNSDKHISTIDANGIALVSIKALKNENEIFKIKLNAQEILIKELIQKIDQIERRLTNSN